MAPEVKLVAVFGLVVAVATTPRQAIWAFTIYAILIAGMARLARVSVAFIALRLSAVLPFVAFALFIPFVATGETVEVWGGLQLSVEGLWGMWNILVKALLGASVSILLTATTEIPDIIRGMGILRVPALFTSIAMFMVRYLELVAQELQRTRVAMISRGYDPRWLWQARPLASSAGAMFVRSYERGERVHAAMVSRGFTGVMPVLGHRRGSRTEWAHGGAVVAVCALVMIVAVVTT